MKTREAELDGRPIKPGDVVYVPVVVNQIDSYGDVVVEFVHHHTGETEWSVYKPSEVRRREGC